MEREASPPPSTPSAIHPSEIRLPGVLHRGRLPRIRKTASTAQQDETDSGHYVPSEQQRALLQEALDPWAPQDGWEALCRRAEVCQDTANLWRKDPRFRAWWTRAYQAGASVYTSQVIVELLRVIRSKKTHDGAKVRAIREYLDRFSKQGQELERETALRAMLEAFSPAAVAGREVRFLARPDPDAPGGTVVAGVVNPGAPPEPEKPLDPPGPTEGPILPTPWNIRAGPPTSEPPLPSVAHVGSEAPERPRRSWIPPAPPAPLGEGPPPAAVTATPERPRLDATGLPGWDPAEIDKAGMVRRRCDRRKRPDWFLVPRAILRGPENKRRGKAVLNHEPGRERTEVPPYPLPPPDREGG